MEINKHFVIFDFVTKTIVIKRLFLYFIYFLGLFSVQAQNSGNPQPGDRVHESIDLFDPDNKVKKLNIPQDGFVLVFKYRWVEAGQGVDNKDSIKILESKIAEMLADGEIKNLKVAFISYEKGTEYNNWLQKMKKDRPLQSNPKYKVEYYNVNGDPVSEAKCKKLFSRLALFGPDGRIVVYSKYIAKFNYAFKNDYIKLKAKAVSDNEAGKKEPLNNGLIHVESGPNNDTVAKATTNKNGDFELSLPNNEKEYNIEVDHANKSTKSVSLLTPEGKEIAILEKKNSGYAYRILKAEVIMLSGGEYEDITMKYELFNSSKQSQLNIEEFIFYDVSQSSIREESKPILTKVIKILRENPNVTLEIISHTDSQGNDDTNLTLSEQRAQAVVNYLVNSGITATRLRSVGKGETEIRNKCTNGIPCTDKQHEFNRRTEFRFTKN